jgi:glycosyltransferase involved in cell wall biosynthesis
LCVLGYEQEATIRETIEGAFAQTYEPLEIVLSDDGSADRTFAIMEEMAAAYAGPHRIVLNRNEPNRGIVGNVNRLMELSRGELVVKNDGDDVSLPHRVERLVEAWLASGRRIKALGSDVMRGDAEGREIGPLGPPRLWRAERTPLAILRGNLYLLGASSAWSREIFDRFGPIDEAAIVEDTIIPFRAAVLGEIGHVDEPLVRYRTGGISGLTPGRGFGWNMMYGQRLKLIRLHMGTRRAALRDMERVEFPEREACARECERFLEQRRYQLDLAERRRRERLAALAPALRRSVSERSPFYAYMTLKYLLDRPAILAYDAKNLWKRRSLS